MAEAVSSESGPDSTRELRKVKKLLAKLANDNLAVRRDLKELRAAQITGAAARPHAPGDAAGTPDPRTAPATAAAGDPATVDPPSLDERDADAGSVGDDGLADTGEEEKAMDAAEGVRRDQRVVDLRARVLQFGADPQAFEIPRGLDTSEAATVFRVPARFRESGEAIRSPLIAMVFNTVYSAGLFTELDLLAAAAFLEDGGDPREAAAFIRDHASAVVEMLADAAFLIDQSTSNSESDRGLARAGVLMATPAEVTSRAPIAQRLASIMQKAGERASADIFRARVKALADATRGEPRPDRSAAAARLPGGRPWVPRRGRGGLTAPASAPPRRGQDRPWVGAPRGRTLQAAGWQRRPRQPQGGIGQGSAGAPAADDA
jgi:hypothetical protein